MSGLRYGLLLSGLLAVGLLWMQTRGGESPDRASVSAEPAGGAPGFLLYSPLLSTTTYLVDKQGRVVHTWESELAPGASVYLLENGHLLRCSREPLAMFRGGGQGGRIEEIAWDGTPVWNWVVASDERLQHHDIEPLPNGNVLAIVWERKTVEEAVRAGRDRRRLGRAGLWPDGILEVRPEPPQGGRIVWEWHAWDHLIQEHDPERENYGRVSEHPELIDINGGRDPEPASNALLERLRALGYLAQRTTAADRVADFMHTNSIAYHPGLDQIALSVPNFDEIWILDHSTTSEEAAGHSGGRAGMGGDLLYRWGNPHAYGRGRPHDQQLFSQHDARWIPDGYPGAGNLMVFNNRSRRSRKRYSSVLEIQPPLDAEGRYTRGPDGRFGPEKPAWEYSAPDKSSFFADFISGAQRLANGNTLISSGPQGRIFEVDPKGRIVWEYQNPYSGDAPNPAGDPPFSLFRATLIPPDHPGLAGRLLEPLDPQPGGERGNRGRPPAGPRDVEKPIGTPTD